MLLESAADAEYRALAETLLAENESAIEVELVTPRAAAVEEYAIHVEPFQ